MNEILPLTEMLIKSILPDSGNSAMETRARPIRRVSDLVSPPPNAPDQRPPQAAARRATLRLEIRIVDQNNPQSQEAP
ncbi:unnamed protein product [Lota lota]